MAFDPKEKQYTIGEKIKFYQAKLIQARQYGSVAGELSAKAKLADLYSRRKPDSVIYFTDKPNMLPNSNAHGHCYLVTDLLDNKLGVNRISHTKKHQNVMPLYGYNMADYGVSLLQLETEYFDRKGNPIDFREGYVPLGGVDLMPKILISQAKPKIKQLEINKRSHAEWLRKIKK
ncbi:MAG: hypothetical protein WC509_03345 [Candidatus Izemoplasmatales bacterium]